MDLKSSEYIEKQPCIPFLEEFAFQTLVSGNQSDSKEDSNLLLLLMTKDLSIFPQGLHLAFQEYEYVNSSNENRLAFFNLFVTCFANINKNFSSMKISDYFQFIKLLCPNFPETFIVFLFEHLPSDIQDTTHVDYLEFVSTFKLCFLFQNDLFSLRKYFSLQSTDNNDKSRLNLEELVDAKTLLQYCKNFKLVSLMTDHPLVIPYEVLKDVINDTLSITYSQLVNLLKMHTYITQL